MVSKDLRDHLKGLFSAAIPEQEPGPEAGEKWEESPLEETVVAGLLEGRDVGERVVAEPPVVEAPPSVPLESEVTRKEQGIPSTSTTSWELKLGRQRIRILNILLYGVIVLGGAPLVFLLIRFIWQKPMVWSGFHTLYCTAYTVAVVVTLIQWLFNSSLTSAVREVEEKRAEATRSQMLLEERVEELAAASALLQRRTLQFQAAARVSCAIISVLDPDELVQEVVNQIRDRFDLYYVGLFLMDESGQGAVLRAGTGEAGHQMLAQGHGFGANSDSVVGHCIASGHARIALDLASAQARFSTAQASAEPGEETVRCDDEIEIIQINPLLPETRSEMVLPLLSRDRVIGALDIHSTEREAFSKEDILVLQAMADQIVVAIENAQVFAETQARLEKMEERQRSLMREQRSGLTPGRVAPLYERTRPDVPPLGEATLPEVERAVAQQEIVAQPGTGDGTGEAALVAPISLRGQVIGALGLQEMEGGRRWTDDEIALIEAIADQMALAIENARLLEATRQRARREQLLAGITARVRASTDVDTILRTAVRELARALGASDGLIRLGVGDGASPLQADEELVDVSSQ
ncbi:MAG: GAF domain-containing protein [Anaerolineae bacterium]